MYKYYTAVVGQHTEVFVTPTTAERPEVEDSTAVMRSEDGTVLGRCWG